MLVPVSMQISFPSELGYEIIARDAVATFARCTGFAYDRLDDIKTVVGEACINAIEHGNLLTPGLQVNILCIYDYHRHRLTVEVNDHGLKHHKPDKIPRTIEEKIAGLGPMRGMGMLLIQALTDESYFVDASTGGNCLCLMWYLHPTSIENQQATGTAVS